MNAYKPISLQLPPEVCICECWAREGIQNEPTVIPTEAKLRLIDSFVEAGFRVIEAVSFAHPKYLPQFADAEDILKQVPRRQGVRYRAIVANMRALERCVEAKRSGCGVEEVAFILSASEPYNLANVKMSHAENIPLLEEMCKIALTEKLDIVGWLLNSFGCELAGDIDAPVVRDLGRWWLDQGARFVGFGDTHGVANPAQVYRFLDYMANYGFTPGNTIAHFHDTRGNGIANSVAALQCNMLYFDSSLGATGGPPAFANQVAGNRSSSSGNCATEDLVCLFEEMGVQTGIDIPRLLQAGLDAEAVMGRTLRANTVSRGPVPHIKKSSTSDESQ
ncbi:MAG TPA: hydroxymethylglutaryl-CoA lyase [Candidatus Limnocylindrales bacterium]|nr:hydroxymethylglutaryl-CoA lyase [Candidatus Limnocylindrales bacterium]